MKTPELRPAQIEKLLKQCKHIVRTTILPQGDQYGTWYAPLETEHADLICTKLDKLASAGGSGKDKK